MRPVIVDFHDQCSLDGPGGAEYSDVRQLLISTHTGGVRTVLTNATTGRHVCTSWAGYGRKPAYQGTIESMSYCSWDSLGVVRAGETLDLESVYDSAEAVPGAMGIMMLHVYETDDLTEPSPAPPEVSGASPPPSAAPPPRHGSHHGHH